MHGLLLTNTGFGRLVYLGTLVYLNIKVSIKKSIKAGIEIGIKDDNRKILRQIVTQKSYIYRRSPC
jgi:hypothetical protein